MAILILGLALFLGVHLVPALPAVRSKLFTALGEPRYKGAFSVISAIGLVLIVIGYVKAPSEPRLFNPLPAAIMTAPFAMAVSFVLLAAANMKTHIRRALGHPMLIGVGIWAVVHLLANGHAKAVLLFGGFLAYAAIDLVSAVLRNATRSFSPVARQDAIAVAAGVGLALLVMAFHGTLFGARVVSWGV